MKTIKFLMITFFLFSQLCVQAQYGFKVEKEGNASKTILFIPGFASSGEVYDETVEKLKDEYTCYQLTMPGFAGVKSQKEASFELWKEQLASFIQQENIEKPILVGHSMGGGLAMALAADYPTLVSKVIIIDALPCLAAMSNPSFQSKENIDCSTNVKQITAMKDEDFKQMQQQASRQMTTQTDKANEILKWSLASNRTTFAKMYCDFYNTDLREKIAKIEIPVYVLLESYFVNFKDVIEKQYQSLPHKKLVYANKGLHFIMYDDKDWYFSKLNEFLAEENDF